MTQALGNVNIEEDDLSDEYDFMDDDDDAQQRRRAEKTRRRAPQYKYMDIMQKLANREIEEVCIDLEDLATVRPTSSARDALLLKLVQYEEQVNNPEPQRLVESIEKNAKHYVEILSRAIDKNLPEPSADVALVGRAPSPDHPG